MEHTQEQYNRVRDNFYGGILNEAEQRNEAREVTKDRMVEILSERVHFSEDHISTLIDKAQITGASYIQSEVSEVAYDLAETYAKTFLQMHADKDIDELSEDYIDAWLESEYMSMDLPLSFIVDNAEHISFSEAATLIEQCAEEWDEAIRAFKEQNPGLLDKVALEVADDLDRITNDDAEMLVIVNTDIAAEFCEDELDDIMDMMEGGPIEIGFPQEHLDWIAQELVPEYVEFIDFSELEGVDNVHDELVSQLKSMMLEGEDYFGTELNIKGRWYKIDGSNGAIEAIRELLNEREN